MGEGLQSSHLCSRSALLSEWNFPRYIRGRERCCSMAGCWMRGGALASTSLMASRTSQFHCKHQLVWCSAPQLFFLSLPALPFPSDNGGTVRSFTASQRPLLLTHKFQGRKKKWQILIGLWVYTDLYWLIFSRMSLQRKKTSCLTRMLRLTLTFRTFHNQYWLCRSSEPSGAWFCNCFYQQLMVSRIEHVMSSAWK